VAEGAVPEGAVPEAEPAPAIPRCSCGHDRRHHMVSPEPTYTGWGKFWVMFMGVSSIPIRLDFRCRVCGEVFDSTVDPTECSALL
jgi:hypothetical protein